MRILNGMMNLQLVYFAFDGSGDGNDLTPDEFMSVVSEIIPQFKNVTKIIKYSSSAHIYKDEEMLSKHNGFHIFFWSIILKK
ncbi:MAG: hypothetical protein ACTFAL_13545 [Candidatus Electronema sp. V4]|uniref:hypothetical protein n=1 Tax=Candidatus Electronema sp. V4 TaxID=3454756 RepID=UPI0040557F5F